MKNDNLKFKVLNLALSFLVFSFAFYVPAISRAAVSQLVFTTDPRSVAPGVISDKLTVSSGEVVGEISDLSLTSSSATGEFVNESGEAVRPTWNSNWANRTFYYRDSTAGAYTLTATLTTRTSQQSWSATQVITVGNGFGDDDGNDTDNNDNSGDNNNASPANTTQNDSGGGGNDALSTHASPAPIGKIAPLEPLKVGAGRPRLASVHSPVVFRPESSGPISQTARFQWSFGDGGSATGEQVVHVYYFPGEYNVVLNAVGQGGETAVGRTTVLVIQPKVSFVSSPVDNHVKLINHSVYELNLGGWQIIQGQGGTTFHFPADTIVAAGKGTIVPAAYLGFSLSASPPLTLTFPDATPALTAAPAPNPEELKVLSLSLRRLSAEVAKLEVSRRTAAAIAPAPIIEHSFSSVQPPSPPPVVLAAIPLPKPPGLFARIKNWFGK